MRHFKPYLFTIMSLCGTISAAQVYADTIVTKSELSSWGYKTSKLRYPLHYCDTKLDDRTYRGAQSIRSLKPLKDEANTYYRYTIIHERFNSTDAAAQRLAALRLPSHQTIMYSKTCELLTGFNDEREVYLIHTDVSMFTYTERDRVLKLLKNHINKLRKRPSQSK